MKANNGDFKITNIYFLSKINKRKRYKSMLFYLVSEKTANTLLLKDLLDIVEKSCIIE